MTTRPCAYLPRDQHLKMIPTKKKKTVSKKPTLRLMKKETRYHEKTMREEFCAVHYRSHDAESTGVKQGKLQPPALTFGFSTLARPLRLHSGIRR